jgi:tRNA threonylcarbamoyladenosine biosynthesis protein TsaE
MRTTYTISTLADWPVFVSTLLATLPTTAVVTLHGDLGAGKTTFVQQLGQFLGVTDPITSPTFGILARYTTSHPIWQTLLHMDAYRLEEVSELGPLHFTDLLTEPHTLFCIEWADRITAALPQTTIHLTLAIEAADARRVVVETHSEWLAHR